MIKNYLHNVREAFKTKEGVFHQLFAWFLFLLTLSQIVGTLLFIALLVTSLVKFRKSYRLTNLKPIIPLLPLFLLYTLYIAGMFYTENQAYGWSKMETRLSLLLIPMFLGTLNTDLIKSNLKKYMMHYIAGCTLAVFICITRALVLFSYEIYCRQANIPLDAYPYTNYFFYSYLSFYMHYGYFAMYMLASILFIVWFLFINPNSASSSEKKWLKIILPFQVLFVLMLIAKAGIMGLLFSSVCIGLYIITKKRKLKYSIGVLLFLLILGILLATVIPGTSQRIQGMIDAVTEQEDDPASTESTQVRVHAWKASAILIKQSNFWGYGTGDGQDELVKKYIELNYTGALERKINCHNQFLQTMLAVGSSGAILLALFFFLLFYYSWKNRSLLLFIFAAITLLGHLTESYLETQAGVYFTMLFSFILLLLSHSKPKEEHLSSL